MDVLKFEIHNIKNINDAILELPFDNGVYTFVGSNGCGKSTIMLCMSQLLYPTQLRKLRDGDIDKGSYIKFVIDTQWCQWKVNDSLKWSYVGNDIRFSGLYEGSLFYGTRFEDSTNIEELIKKGKIGANEIADADEPVKRQLSYILHGDTNHYTTLKRLKNKNVADRLGIRNRPYFVKTNGVLISQYRMSSGECMLISLLHFLYNSIERRSLPVNQKALVLIDELELALHPVAVVRLMEYLHQLVKEHSNLVVFLSTHSPEVIKTMNPMDLFKVSNADGTMTVERNCYPSYLIRDLYSNVSPDFLLLVEDKLAQLVVNKILSNYSLRNSKLIHCVPVGGAANVLALHKELYQKKILGTNTQIVSILDGDMEKTLTKEQKSIPHLFLPIKSVEKFIYEVIKENKHPELRRIINDKYFIVNSLDNIVADYTKETMKNLSDNNKNFYSKIRKELMNIGTDEEVFVNGLCDDIMSKIDVSKFVASLRKLTS